MVVRVIAVEGPVIAEIRTRVQRLREVHRPRLASARRYTGQQYSRPTLGKLRRHSTPPLYVGPRGQRLYSDKTHLQQKPKFGESHEGPREKLDSIHFVDALEWIIE